MKPAIRTRPVTITLIEEWWRDIYHLATLGLAEHGTTRDAAIDALLQQFFAAGMADIEYGWHGDVRNPDGE